MNKVKDIRNIFIKKYKNEDFVIDKSGGKVIELLGYSFIADEDSIFGDVNWTYVNKELTWYEAQSLNVYDMPNPPKIWKMIADKNGYINSNYGWVIFSEENENQYHNALEVLKLHKDTRRSIMIYNRPSMQTEYNKNGMSDFMCTNAVGFCVRDNMLCCIVQMRSNDAWAGYRNDRAWHNYVLNKMYKDLLTVYPELKKGYIIWNAMSLHIYERQFYLLDNYAETGLIHISKKEYFNKNK